MTREEKSSAGLSGAGIGIRNYFGSRNGFNLDQSQNMCQHPIIKRITTF